MPNTASQRSCGSRITWTRTPATFDRQDFGAPDHSFLTHLHNGHTAPESDCNPNNTMTKIGAHGYAPKQWVDNCYLNYPAGGDEREKQSFLWFHDHRMDHTSSNVYKGMVGLYSIYDPTNSTDMGDETRGLRLPGVRRNNADGSFDVDYDIRWPCTTAGWTTALPSTRIFTLAPGRHTRSGGGSPFSGTSRIRASLAMFSRSTARRLPYCK